MARVSRPMSSTGRHQHYFQQRQQQQQQQLQQKYYQPAQAMSEAPSAHTTNDNYQQANFEANMPVQHQFSTRGISSFQPQNRFQHQHDFQQQRQDFDSFHGSSAGNPGFQHGVVQQHFENTFDDPLCTGLVDDAMDTHHASFERINDSVELSILNAPNVPLQAQPQFEAGTQFGGKVRNPYTQPQQQQYTVPSNPYNKKLQQQHDRPPMQEVVVRGISGSQGEGDDASQLFDDAFL